MSFTCVACCLVFDDASAQKDHYNSDWHIENLKRKCRGEAPLSYDSYQDHCTEEPLEQAPQRNRYECGLCRKSFGSIKAYENHCQSNKHLERSAAMMSISPPEDEAPVEDIPIETDNFEILEVTDCLFCEHSFETIEECLDHMKTVHSFFIPDLEHLSDLEGFLEYLTVVVGIDLTCMWCLNRGKSGFSHLSDLQAHMRDCGHTKINLAVFGEALAPFYDYDASPDDIFTSQRQRKGRLVVDVEESDVGKALVLSDGSRVYARGCLLSHFHCRALAGAADPGKYSKLLSDVPNRPNNVLSKMNAYATPGWQNSVDESFRSRSKFFRTEKRKQLEIGVKQNKLQVIRLDVVF
ncbi:hypothetical protein GEMRC1_006797 [Eukaryota sp. GEM-RC1]